MTDKDLITVLIDANTALSSLRSSIEGKDSLDRAEIEELVQRIKHTQSRLVDDIVYCNRQNDNKSSSTYTELRRDGFISVRVKR